MQQVLENLDQELKSIKRTMRLAKSALEEGLEVQQEAQELHASFSAFMQVLGGVLKALRDYYASLKEDDLELEKSLTKLKHAQAKIATPLGVLEKPGSAQEVLEVLEGLQTSISDLKSVLEGLQSKPSQPTPQNFATPKGAKKYCPQSKEELKKLVADESVHLGDIDISKITDLSYVFSESNRKNFEGLETWDVSNANNMEGMFEKAIHFNHDISSWDVSRVKNMDGMFKDCQNFNQPLNNWDVSRVEGMLQMFEGCTHFNQPLGDWDVSGVEDMQDMFANCQNFNQPLNSWDVSNVEDMHSMFEGCQNFNQPLNDWDISSVKNMAGMFFKCANFNQSLENW
ncbi:BspA family leucine-rich repeat surface protein, partial [Helicobacter bizzozeronii]|uniref:BspA family leucine-rich repeat surface protein n=1 Tax=Helicobacter bizzozeronii TaxID=56877 RepID=UPI000CF03404